MFNLHARTCQHQHTRTRTFPGLKQCWCVSVCGVARPAAIRIHLSFIEEGKKRQPTLPVLSSHHRSYSITSRTWPDSHAHRLPGLCQQVLTLCKFLAAFLFQPCGIHSISILTLNRRFPQIPNLQSNLSCGPFIEAKDPSHCNPPHHDRNAGPAIMVFCKPAFAGILTGNRPVHHGIQFGYK